MPDIGEKIRELRESRGLSRKAFGDQVGISEAKVQALEIGKQRVDHEALYNIADRLSVDANWLLGLGQPTTSGGDDAPDEVAAQFVPVPRYSVSAQAGNGGSFAGDYLDVTYYAFNVEWIKRRGLDRHMLNVIEVRGDSMEPKLAAGDLILIDRAQSSPSDGSTYVIRLGDELVVKSIQRLGRDKIALISANTFYPPREVDLPGNVADFQIIGRVVASMHEW